MPTVSAAASGAAVAALLAFSASSGMTQPAPFAGDGARPAPVAAGLFRTMCGFCHGAQAHGAAGPDLTRSAIATGDGSGRGLGLFLKTGRPAVGMPAFPDLTAAQAADLAAYIRSQASDASGPHIDPRSILIGDPKAGEAFFNGPGRCKTCHSAAGDLKGVGARYDPMVLQGRVINPRVVKGDSPVRPGPPVTVTVTEPDGRRTEGQLVQVNDFWVTLIDGSGVRRTFNRDNATPRVEVHDPAEAHRQMMFTWKDRDMWNVTAYLAGLK